MVSGVFSVVVLVWLDVKDGRGGVTGGGEKHFISFLPFPRAFLDISSWLSSCFRDVKDETARKKTLSLNTIFSNFKMKKI
jgi:hypothetical protein